jgi:hypothetical protein
MGGIKDEMTAGWVPSLNLTPAWVALQLFWDAETTLPIL